jgi:hypothetical protein
VCVYAPSLDLVVAVRGELVENVVVDAVVRGVLDWLPWSIDQPPAALVLDRDGHRAPSSPRQGRWQLCLVCRRQRPLLRRRGPSWRSILCLRTCKPACLLCLESIIPTFF